MRCGDLGHYFLINPKDPEDVFVLECTEISCADTPRDGIPLPTPSDADTVPIIITHDGIRGVARKRNGVIETANLISGIIDTGCTRRKTKP